MKSTVFFVQSGCVLPLLMIFNLFFGWLFLSPLLWLAVEAILIVLFLANSFLLAKKMVFGPSKRKGAIDVEGHVVEEKDNHGKLSKK